ncbi:MAG: hypothetical protein ABWZ80_05305 [Beijerinckiaceae bacterium]
MTPQVLMNKSAVAMIDGAIRELEKHRGDRNFFLSLIWHTNMEGDLGSRRLGLGVYDSDRDVAGLHLIATVNGVKVYCQLPEAETASTLRISGDGKSMYAMST